MPMWLQTCLAEVWEVLATPRIGYPPLTFLSAFALAVAVLAARRRAQHKAWHLGLVVRALLPRKVLFSPSAQLEIKYIVFQALSVGFLFGVLIVPGLLVAATTRHGLVAAFGQPSPSTLPLPLLTFFYTVGIFLAYEFGYWIDHYLSHRVPFLWEFHKVHHTATNLTMLTVFRVHPVDTIVFNNILALTGGVFYALFTWMVGRDLNDIMILGTNIFLFAGLMTIIHLQHTEVWIAFTGILGHVLMSPAHHQIHHSRDAAHHGCNLGSCLCVFDWLFGTLMIPSRRNMRLRFGVDEHDPASQSLVASFLQPFANVARMVARRLSRAPRRSNAAAQAAFERSAT